jgi:hypothetical protein
MVYIQVCGYWLVTAVHDVDMASLQKPTIKPISTAVIMVVFVLVVVVAVVVVVVVVVVAVVVVVVVVVVVEVLTMITKFNFILNNSTSLKHFGGIA